jgi:hypothetical protein
LRTVRTWRLGGLIPAEHPLEGAGWKAIWKAGSSETAFQSEAGSRSHLPYLALLLQRAIFDRRIGIASRRFQPPELISCTDAGADFEPLAR